MFRIFILLLCAAALSRATYIKPLEELHDFIEIDDADIDEMASVMTDEPTTATMDTPPSSTASTTTTTTVSPLGPDDLALVDKIIIGFTVALVAGVLIGGIVMSCVNKKKSKKAKKAKEAKDKMLRDQRLQWDNPSFRD